MSPVLSSPLPRPLLFGASVTLGGLLATHTLSACKKNECATVDCDYTHVTLDIVDDEGEESWASKVTYTLVPYDDKGKLMDEDALDDAGIDPDEVRKAACVGADQDECARWVAAAGFGVYTFTAVMADTDEGTEIQVQCKLDLAPPTSSENKGCCGLVSTDDTELILDEDDLDAESDSGDTGSTSETGDGTIPDCK